MFDFDVGEGGFVLWAVVDELFTSVNVAVVPHFFESFIHARDDVFVEREGEVVPGARGAESADLELHVPSLFLDEVPDAGIELVAGIFEARMADGFEGALVNDPGFETGVVGTWDIPG